MTCIGDDRIQIWRTHHLIEPIMPLRPAWKKVLVNHNNGAVAVTGSKEVTEYTVRVGFDRLDEWRFGVCSLKYQNETAETTLMNTVDRTRRVRTTPRNTRGYHV